MLSLPRVLLSLPINDLPYLNSTNFDNAVASLKIEGNCCWSFFTESNFQGESLSLQKGDYKSATQIKEIFKKASSVTSKCWSRIWIKVKNKRNNILNLKTYYVFKLLLEFFHRAKLSRRITHLTKGRLQKCHSNQRNLQKSIFCY